MLQWQSSSRMVEAGSRSAPRRFLCVPANPALVLTQQKQESPWAGAELPAVLRELHLPMSPVWCSPAERRARTGKRRETPSSGAAHQHAKHKPKNQARPCNGRSSPWTFLPVDIPPHGSSGRQSLQQVLSSQSSAGGWGISGWALLLSQHHNSGFLPSVHAPEHLVDEGASEP